MPRAHSDSLPDTLYSADAVRAMDRYLIDHQGIAGFELMVRAARAVFRQLLRRWPSPACVTVLCGAGNNAGDGYLVAAAALKHGLLVRCVAVADPERLSGDAKRACEQLLASGGEIARWEALNESERQALLSTSEVVVDALLGTGLTGAPRQPFAEVIELCNQFAPAVLAVDVPSGLDATMGAASGPVIRADLTVTFIALKAGLYTGKGPDCTGLVIFDALDDAATQAHALHTPLARHISWPALAPQLPVRPASAHKGRFGHVVIVAGDQGYGGAGILAAEAAVRSGAGLVSLATRPEHVAPMLGRCPSVMALGITHGSQLAGLLAVATVIVCGPGLGRSAWGQQMLQQVIRTGKPRVLDADALNLMSQRALVKSENHILTPHPGEAARLLGVSVAEIEADRIQAAKTLQKQFGGVVLLKGAGTVIATPHGVPCVVSGSNPGLATGGMGDVLSGIIGSLWAQKPLQI